VTKLSGTLAALNALGSAWRGDWSEFDGRTLRCQLDEIAALAQKEVCGEDVKRDLAGFFAGNDICPTCRSWTEHCHCGGWGGR
jgi:hypothetical protein